jgi:hypothetical protein
MTPHNGVKPYHGSEGDSIDVASERVKHRLLSGDVGGRDQPPLAQCRANADGSPPACSPTHAGPVRLLLRLSLLPVAAFARDLDFTATRAGVDFSSQLQTWDGFGFNYVETAQTTDYAEYCSINSLVFPTDGQESTLNLPRQTS